MRNTGKITIISVESQKGGAGKTTAALAAARLLLEKYEVVYLDLDITGTEARHVCEALEKQPLWEKLHLVKEAAKTDKDPEDADIMSRFKIYMSGKTPPPPILERKKINIISSSLGAAEAEDGFLYGPAVLFDELHSEMLLQMLRELVEECAERLLEDDERLAVILDNSPGYTGLSPMIEKWLTDLGPECGKFLFVCTPDHQDIQASLQAAERIERLFNDKIAAAQCFQAVLDEPEAQREPLTKNQKKFLVRLAEANLNAQAHKECAASFRGKKHDACVDCGLCFYRNGKFGDKVPPVEATKYLALLLNKVPGLLKADAYDYAPLPEELAATRPDLRADLENCRVYFSDAISMQFLQHKITKRPDSLEKETTARECIKALEAIRQTFLDHFERPNEERGKSALDACTRATVNNVFHFISMTDDATRLIFKESAYPDDHFWRGAHSLLRFQFHGLLDIFPYNAQVATEKTLALGIRRTMLEWLDEKQLLEKFEDGSNIVSAITCVRNEHVDFMTTAIVILSLAFSMLGSKDKNVDKYAAAVLVMLLFYYSTGKKAHMSNAEQPRTKIDGERLEKIKLAVEASGKRLANLKEASSVLIRSLQTLAASQRADAILPYVYDLARTAIVETTRTPEQALEGLKQLGAPDVSGHGENMTIVFNPDALETLTSYTELAEFDVPFTAILGKNRWNLL